MTDCFIYDAVRTPRGKGRKKNGALADAPPLRMAKAVLEALPARGGFDSAEISGLSLISVTASMISFVNVCGCPDRPRIVVGLSRLMASRKLSVNSPS